ncbi:MAG: tRNA (N6-threonylcarbamoyladenosine(37)-N6)-methyltransferase TrmO [Anaerolineae bacterium]|jgi:tRNA (adenine37-N6)-methyltransferase|nr:tRNA (N6-threonylcarbamoyladenosine(37)-N6)-methyltransferase TrmO [Anaerolineae bacterium]MBT7075430.1 tRNA (N6-threonylcarbamoyladenosine(37)-N6)-methyltransferase TrmO [Anaerolineae bacterium]MBT7782925.1 tRNA (N6-threonylcarbamoyladenosine(37)-N6)-methyltransferase TrmO [Anaerolineae bacterium]
MSITYSPIGIIHSPFTKLSGMPIQPTSESSAKGHLEIFSEFAEGLKDLDGFSHIYLIYHLHKATSAKLQLKPFLDNKPHGVFSTRAPRRPNPIGLSLVKIARVQENFIYIENIDILNKTPLLDIKPYIPEFEGAHEIRIGWLENSKGNITKKKSDERFLNQK